MVGVGLFVFYDYSYLEFELLEQKLLTLPTRINLGNPYSRNSLSFRIIFSFFCVVLFRLLIDLFSFDHCIVFPSSFCGFWLVLWYLQLFLMYIAKYKIDGSTNDDTTVLWESFRILMKCYRMQPDMECY